MIGLGRTDVSLSDYSTEWHLSFLEEKDALLAILDSDVMDIQHVGSTSIPGPKGKANYRYCRWV